MKAVFLDFKSVDVDDLDLSALHRSHDDWTLHDETYHNETAERINHAGIVVTNKVVFDAETLAALPDLQYLELRENNVGDAGLEHLKRINKIRLLDVRDCQRVTDAGLGHLTGLMSLRAIRLRNPAISAGCS